MACPVINLLGYDRIAKHYCCASHACFAYISVHYCRLPYTVMFFTHHMWIGGLCIVGAGAHAAIFMDRDYNPAWNYNNLLDPVVRLRNANVSF